MEVKLPSNCGDPSGFADIGPTATAFAPSVAPPETKIVDGHSDGEHPGLPESSESECGAKGEYRDSDSSDCESTFSLGVRPPRFEHRLLSRNGHIRDLSIPDYADSEVSDGDEPDHGIVDSSDDENEFEDEPATQKGQGIDNAGANPKHPFGVLDSKRSGLLIRL